MKLIVGLGNPGLEYEDTRHNAGFTAVKKLAEENKISIKKRIYNGLAGEGKIEGHNVMLLLPQTFMNLSGESVRQAVQKVNDLSEILVVYDDIDLMLGHIRFKPSGSNGGHKGLKSIIECIGTQEIPRLRIGIRPKEKVYDTKDFVLKPFLKEEKKELKSVMERALGGMHLWLERGIDITMTRYN